MLSWTINVTTTGLSEEQVKELKVLILKGNEKIMSEITDLRDQVAADNAVISENLANIHQDMVVLDQKITDLLNNGGLSDADKAALTDIKNMSAAQVVATKSLADEHPETP